MLSSEIDISWLRRGSSMLRASVWLLSLMVVLPLQMGETLWAFPGCDAGWIQRGRVCYKLVTTMNVSWPIANVYCNAVGGTLAELQNQDEADFARNLATTHNTFCLWIGVLDLNNERQWVSASSHKPVTFTDWAPGEPNKSGGRMENCVCLYKPLGNKWNDESCTTAGDFLCQKKIN